MRKKTFLLLLVILVAGFTIRFYPIQTGCHSWDETVYLQHAEIIAGLRENNYSEMDFRPPLLSLILAAVFLIEKSIINAHFTVALLATATIYLTYKIGSEIAGKETGMLASIFVLLNPLHIKFSHLILTDAILPMLWALTFLCAYKARENHRKRNYIFTGIAIALAVYMKFTSLILLPLVVLLLVFDSMSLKTLKRKNLWLMIFVFILFLAPYFFYSQTVYGNFLHTIQKQYEVVSWSFSSPVEFYLTHFLELFPLVFTIGLIGLFYNKEQKTNHSLLLWILIPLFALSLVSHKEIRFLLPILPFLSIAAATGYMRIFKAIPKRNKYLSTVLILLVIISASWFLYQESGHLQALEKQNLTWNTKTDVCEASLWLKENTREDALVYANHKWPQIAYYSYRDIHLIPVYPFDNITKMRQNHMPDEGYLVLYPGQPEGFTLQKVLKNPRFMHLKRFGEIYVFKYYS